MRTFANATVVFILAFYFFWWLPSVAYGQFYRMDTMSLRKIENAVKEFMEDEEVVGCSIGILRLGEISYLRGFGYADKEAQKPATELTLYRTASVAKFITAVIAVKLWEEGILDIDADIRQYVPSFPEKQEGIITARHLLSNLAGIRNYEEYEWKSVEDYMRENPRHSAINAIEIFKNATLKHPPGEEYLYSTFGFNLLGAVLEGATGRRYEELLHRYLQCRLRLPFLQIEYATNRPYPLEAKGYKHDEDDNIVPSTDTFEVSWKAPGGGLLATTIDGVLLLQGVMEHCIFSSSTFLDSMAVERRTKSGSGVDYGFGAAVEQRNGKRIMSHLGGQGKTRTLIYFSPDTKTGIVIFSNTEKVELYPLARKLFDIAEKSKFMGARFKPIPEEIPVPRLKFPVGRADIQAGRVTLDWEDEALASHYEVQIDTTALFLQPIAWQLTRRSEVQMQGLQQQKPYFWRVRARNEMMYDGTFSPWSQPLLFFTGKDDNPIPVTGE